MEAAEGHTIVYTDSDGRLRFQRAWHGTGASFDRFSTEHIGEGEGQQAFGWGLYFSDNKEIARGYAEKLGISLERYNSTLSYLLGREEKARDRYTKEMETLDRMRSDPGWLQSWKGSDTYKAIMAGERPDSPAFKRLPFKDRFALKTVRYTHPDATPAETAKLYLRRALRDQRVNVSEARRAYNEAASELRDYSRSQNIRTLYEVEIPDGPYIDWDEPIPENVLEKLWTVIQENSAYADEETRKAIFAAGVDGLDGLADVITYDSPKDLSDFLSELGYAGIRYPAGTLSGHSDGKSHNYVIFNDEDVKIISRTRFQDAVLNTVQDVITGEPMVMEEAPVAIDMSDLPASKKAILNYAAKNNVRGAYTVKDNGKQVEVTRNSLKEIMWRQTSPRMDKDLVSAKLKSALMVPQIIEGMKYVGTYPNEDTKVDTDAFDYYLSLVRIDGSDWVVRSVVAELRSGGRYYDHTLTKKEDILGRGRIRVRAVPDMSPRIYDKTLLRILQEAVTREVEAATHPERARGEAVRAGLSAIEGVELSADAAVHEEDGLEGIRALWQDSVNAGGSPRLSRT